MQCFDLACPPRVDQRRRAPRFSQQAAALLERLADRRDPKSEILGIEAVAAGVEIRIACDLMIAGIDAAAGKHQRPGIKIDLIMAHHHEDFDFAVAVGAGAVAQQQDGGCRAGFGDFGHAISPPRWIAAASRRDDRPALPATAGSRPRPLRLR